MFAPRNRGVHQIIHSCRLWWMREVTNVYLFESQRRAREEKGAYRDNER